MKRVVFTIDEAQMWEATRSPAGAIETREMLGQVFLDIATRSLMTHSAKALQMRGLAIESIEEVEK